MVNEQPKKVDYKLWIEQPENYPTCLALRPYQEPASRVNDFKTSPKSYQTCILCSTTLYVLVKCIYFKPSKKEEVQKLFKGFNLLKAQDPPPETPEEKTEEKN